MSGKDFCFEIFGKFLRIIFLGTSAIPECSRCEAMFRSIELYEAHREVCCGGKVSRIFFAPKYLLFYKKL